MKTTPTPPRNELMRPRVARAGKMLLRRPGPITRGVRLRSAILPCQGDDRRSTAT